MLEITEIQHRGELPRYEQEWQGLLEASGNKAVFLTYPWLSAWLDHFWADKPLLFLLVRSEGKLVGVAPFLVNEEEDCLSLPANRWAAHSDVACTANKEDVLQAMVGHLKTRFRRLRLKLGRIAASSDLCLVLPHVLEKHRLIHIRTESYGSPYLRIDRSWSEFLESKSRHFRSELKRKSKGIEKTDRVEFVKYTQPEQCAAAMQEVLHIERNSWKEQNGTSFTAGPGLKEFYSDLAVRCARAGVLCIYTLRFESEPIAHVYGILHGRTYYALKTSYCESHKHLSPGVVLFNHCLRDAFDSRLTEFDFLGDESRWKNELASEVRPYARMTVCPRTLLSRLRQCIEHRVKPYLKARLPLIVEARRGLEGLGDTAR